MVNEDDRCPVAPEFDDAAFGSAPMVKVLGPCTVTGLQLEADPGDIELSSVQRTIVCRLAIARPGFVGTDEISDAIWGESTPATAQTSIHNQISRIRARLGPESIVTEGGHYRLTLPTDVEYVYSALDTAERLILDAQHDDSTEVIDRALSLFRGEPYLELKECTPATSQREQLSEIRRSLETMRLVCAIECNRTAWSVPEAERLVSETPHDEQRWILLIRSLDLSGRRGDALAAYERARRALAEGLGLAPSEALRAAEAAVLTDTPGGASHRVPKLIGRRSLISEITSLAESEPAVVVFGEPGIGKSRVLSQIRRQMRQPGRVISYSHCSIHPVSPLETLRDLADGLGITFTNVSDPATAFAEITSQALDGSESVTFVIDDLDRAGPTTIEALSTASQLDRVNIVAAVSHSEANAFSQWARLVEVTPLDADELAEFAEQFIRLSPEVVERDDRIRWLIEMSGGNPAFLEHLLEAPEWLSGETAEGLSESLTKRRDSVGLNGLREIIGVRLSRLDPITSSALEIASVAGVRSSQNLLNTIADPEGVRGAISAGLLEAYNEIDDEIWVRFRHGAVRRAVYDDLAPGRRIEAHYRVASALRDLGAPVSLLAQHSAPAMELDPSTAARDCLNAAESAVAHGAFGEAAQWYGFALAAIRQGGLGDTARVAALIGYGDSLRREGSPDQEQALFDAADAALDLGDEDLISSAVFAVLQLGITSESGGVHQSATELADRALSMVGSGDARALILAGASLAHSMSDDSTLCRELFLRAENEAEARSTRLAVLPFAYLGLGHPDDLALRRSITDELLRISAESADPIARFEGLQLAFSVALQICNGTMAREAVAESAQLIDQVGDVGRRWSLAYQRAALAHLDGSLDEAEQLATEAMTIFATTSPSRSFAAFGGQMLVIRLAQGRIGELVATIEALVAEQPGVPAWNAALALALSDIEPDLSGRYAKAALQGVKMDFTWLAAHIIGGRAAAAAGDRATKDRYIERLTPYSGQGCWQGTCSYGPVDTVLWLLHHANGDATLAKKHRLIALQSAKSLGSRVHEMELT